MKIGDVVMLKSGGPKMTIARRDSMNDFVCVWFGSDGVRYTASFEEALLQLA